MFVVWKEKEEACEVLQFANNDQRIEFRGKKKMLLL